MDAEPHQKLAAEALIKGEIEARALALGFDVVGITSPDQLGLAGERFRAFIEKDQIGDMAWLGERADWRADPKALWSDCRSIIMLGTNYGPASEPLALQKRASRGQISVYAQNRDYHDLIKGRLKQLGGWLIAKHDVAIKVFVDTAPVLEKPLAQKAGLGWQGKHTNLVSTEFGSWLFLGAIYTDMDLSADAEHEGVCGTCTACLEICPTKAFPAPYQLDPTRCISYLTIEHKGHIAREFREAMANRIYGCDDCLAVCPWNKYASLSKEAQFHPRMELSAPLLTHLAALDDPDFRQVFSGSPIKRIGRDRFVRNVLIALGNTEDETVTECVRARLSDNSPLVRAMAVWALTRLLEPAAFNELRRNHIAGETDADVLAEWDAYS